MIFRETGCSLCPHALFSQARSHIIIDLINYRLELNANEGTLKQLEIKLEKLNEER